MRLFAVPAAVLGLAALVLGSRTARADEPAPDPLAKARALESEGQRLLDAGRCAEGARHMVAAWQIRAEVWGGGAQPGRVEPVPGSLTGDRRPAEPSADVRQRIEDLRAALHAQELAIEAARKNGAERAEAEHREKAEALRRELRALKEAVAGDRKERRDAEPSPDARQKFEALRAALHAEELAIEEARKNGAERAEAEHREKAEALRRELEAVKESLVGARKERRDGDVVERLTRVSREYREALVLAEKLAAEGKADEAAAQKARAEKLHRAAQELAAALKAKAPAGEPKGGGRGAAAVEGLAGDVARLREEVAEVRRLLEALKARLSEGK